jgi:hypothetical protein
LTDLVILAVATPHIAIAEEDSSRSSATRNGWLLAVMVADCRDYGQVSGVTKATLIFPAIDPTLPRANITRCQANFQRLSPALKLTGAIQAKV